VKYNQNLSIKQVQKLALTPDLLQSLSLLQMPLPELETYISRQLAENCMLEQEESGVSDEDFSETLSLNSLESPETTEKNDPAKEDFLFGDNPEATYRLNDQNKAETYEIPDPSALSLQEYLLSQLHIANLPSKENLITEFLIGNIDENGYLRSEIQETADIFRVSPKTVENSLHLIQTFDPVGVGARTVEECLLLQLSSNSRDATKEFPYPQELIVLAKVIIADHLHDIADSRLARVANQLKTSLPQIQAAVDLIRTLDPKPGRNFGGSHETGFIIPDVTLRVINTDYIIIINEPTNARLSLNPFYRRFGHNQDAVDEDVLKFIKDKQNAALQLLKSIEQRKITLYHVTESIVNIQKDFLEKGILYLKPLTLRQIADAVGVHQSTVSRAIAGKYIETPKGIYPFKFFFSSSLDAVGGKQVGSESVKKLIKTAIKDEDPKSPLSDQKLMKFLKDKQIITSRRTVAKYREEMMIPSSDKRRRY
jgi:RNA polymerase sigma-54 factor